MRFLVIVKATKQSEAGEMPGEKVLGEMAKFNDQLVKAGVMLDGGGLTPSSQGKRITFEGGKRTVIDGPFAETKELIAGYWLIQAKSMDEAVEWARRAPMDADGRDAQVEIRRLFELEDFQPSPAIDAHREVEKQLKK